MWTYIKYYELREPFFDAYRRANGDTLDYLVDDEKLLATNEYLTLLRNVKDALMICVQFMLGYRYDCEHTQATLHASTSWAIFFRNISHIYFVPSHFIPCHFGNGIFTVNMLLHCNVWRY